MSGQKHILHISGDYPYTKLYRLFLEAASTNDSFRHTMYVPLNAKKEVPEEPPFSNENVNVIFSKDFSGIDRYLYFTKREKILKSIQEQVDMESVDLIHAHFLFSNGSVAKKLKEKYGIPYITAVRNTDINIFFKKQFHLRAQGIKIARSADKITFISPTYKDKMLKFYTPKKYWGNIEERSTVISNGINNYWLDDPYDRDTAPQDKTLNLLYVGEIIPLKNIPLLFKIVRKLKEKGWNITLSLVGKGKLEETLKKETEGEEYIKWLGFISDKEELKKRYRTSDMLILPSFIETFGLVLIEAMSQGLPVLYPMGEAIDGYYEEGKVGFHIDQKNEMDAVGKIEKIMSNYLAISSSCVQEARAFNWDNIARRYENLYTSLLQD